MVSISLYSSPEAEERPPFPALRAQSSFLVLRELHVPLLACIDDKNGASLTGARADWPIKADKGPAGSLSRTSGAVSFQPPVKG